MTYAIPYGNEMLMSSPFGRSRYDVVIAGARCAGASAAMLLARRGLRVLVVDPLRYGSDTLSTHALMRGGVIQLHRWGLLGAIRKAGTPPIESTTFHYGDRIVEIPIKPGDGVHALYAPRRTVLDPILVDAARDAGAEVVHGQALVDLHRDDQGRVRGAAIAGPDRETTDIRADLVIGADGIRSRVARILDVECDYTAPNAACSIYGYWSGLEMDGYHWFYERGVSIGTIPTNDHETCLFALIARSAFLNRRDEGIEALFLDALRRVSAELAERVEASPRPWRLRAFPGARGYLRRATGAGWALVGDAGYFRDPITAHGMTDALREAELLTRAIAVGGEDAMAGYQHGRDRLVRGLLDVTDRIASFEWSLEEVQELHLELNREMKGQVDALRALD